MGLLVGLYVLSSSGVLPFALLLTPTVSSYSFWVLAWVAFLSLQVVEDGTLASSIVRRACKRFYAPALT